MSDKEKHNGRDASPEAVIARQARRIKKLEKELSDLKDAHSEAIEQLECILDAHPQASDTLRDHGLA